MLDRHIPKDLLQQIMSGTMEPYEQFCTRPDFSYAEENPAFIYVDGPPHDFPNRQTRDTTQTAALTAEGITVIRFHHAADSESVVSRYPSGFGKPIEREAP
jgi:very-short-patch-repair endonuclease